MAVAPLLFCPFYLQSEDSVSEPPRYFDPEEHITEKVRNMALVEDITLFQIMFYSGQVQSFLSSTHCPTFPPLI